MWLATGARQGPVRQEKKNVRRLDTHADALTQGTGRDSDPVLVLLVKNPPKMKSFWGKIQGIWQKMTDRAGLPPAVFVRVDTVTMP